VSAPRLGHHYSPKEDPQDEEVPVEVEDLEKEDRYEDLPLHPGCSLALHTILSNVLPPNEPAVFTRAEQISLVFSENREPL